MSKAIRVSDITYENIVKLAYEKRMSQGDVVTEALWPMLAVYLARDADPRSPSERAADDFTAQVLDTQASDRP